MAKGIIDWHRIRALDMEIQYQKTIATHIIYQCITIDSARGSILSIPDIASPRTDSIVEVGGIFS